MVGRGGGARSCTACRPYQRAHVLHWVGNGESLEDFSRAEIGLSWSR